MLSLRRQEKCSDFATRDQASMGIQAFILFLFCFLKYLEYSSPLWSAFESVSTHLPSLLVYLNTGLEAFSSYCLCFASDEEDSASSLELTISLSLFNYICLHNFYYRHGQIFIVFTSRCPKNVENFSTHSGNGYYNTHIFHRVIHQFMIQTGDPEGKK